MGIKKPFIHTIHGVLADEYEQAKKNGYPSFRGRIANYFMHRLANLEEETAHNANLIVTISNYSLEKIQKHYGIEPKQGSDCSKRRGHRKIQTHENLKRLGSNLD